MATATGTTKMHQPRRRWLVVLAGAGLAGCAQSPPAPSAREVVLVADAPAALSDCDQRFLVAAVGAFHYQREAARLASMRSANPHVRGYAALMIEQRSQACRELRQVVQGRQLPWPDGLPADRRAALDALAALPAELFDRRFVEQVGVAEQQAALEVFNVATRTVNDLALRRWARSMLPLLQQQLVLARSVPPTAPVPA